MIRLSCQFEKMNAEQIIQYFLDPPPTEMIKETKIFDKKVEGETEFMKFYQRFKMPLMTERDCLASTTIKRLEGGKIFIQCVSIEDEAYPEKPKTIRMDLFMQGMIEPGEGT